MSVFDGLIDFVAQILAFLYSLPVVGGSYGLAIIMLTMVVMILLTPLTLKATRSTIKMQQVQPELRRIQKKYKDDRETMNAELMKLYSANGINPVGGCLPMVAQMPVFLVLFRILRGLTRRAEDTPFFGLANSIREARGQAPQNGRVFAPDHLSSDSQLYQDLSHDTEMRFGPFDLAERAIDVLRTDWVAAIPYVLLILFVVATSYYQQRQISARRSPTDGEVSPMMQQQQMLLKVLPLFSGAWSFVFPAGLVLYWATSNVFRIGQQAYITHQIYGKEGGSEALAAAKVSQADEEDSEASDSGTKELSKPKQSPKAKNQPKPKDDSESDSSPDARPDPGASKDRNAEWEAMRKKRAGKNGSRNGSDSSSGRITPKGSSASESKKRQKKRKKR